jgi:hypothetical protein
MNREAVKPPGIPSQAELARDEERRDIDRTQEGVEVLTRVGNKLQSFLSSLMKPGSSRDPGYSPPHRNEKLSSVSGFCV